MIYKSVILIIILFINIINCKDKIYTSSDGTGDWSNAANWLVYGNPMQPSDGFVPGLNDYAYLGFSQVQTITNNQMKATALNITLGNGPNTADLTTNYGIQADFLTVYGGSNLLFQILGDPFTNPEYRVDLYGIDMGGVLRTRYGIFYAPDCYIHLFQNSGWVIQDGIVADFLLQSDGAQVIVSNATALVQGASVFLSIWTIDKSNFTLSSPNYSFTIYGSSTVTVTKTTFTSLNSIKVQQAATQLTFVDSRVNLTLETKVPRTTFTDGLVIVDNTVFDCSHLLVLQGTTTQGLLSISRGSNATFYNEIEINESAMFSLRDSTMTTLRSFILDDTSVASIQNSELFVYGDFATLSSSYFLVNASKVVISNKRNPYEEQDRVFFLRGNSSLAFKVGSVGVLDAHLLTSDFSVLEIIDSKLTISEHTVFFNDSRISMLNSSMQIDQVLTMMDRSLFEVTNSIVQVVNKTVFSDNSLYVVANSEFNVIGEFYDFTMNPLGNSIFNNSQLSVTGTFINTGSLFFFYSNVSVGGEFRNYGSLVAALTSFVINGSLTNNENAFLYLELGSIRIVEGTMNLEGGSNMTTLNSIITIEKGTLNLEFNSSLALLNTTLHNSLGELKAVGDIIINKGGNLRNDAHFVLDSNVIPVDNNGDEIFVNSGIMDINGVTKNLREKDITSILVPMKNSGTVNVGRETEIISFQQTSGGLLQLDKSTVHSTNTMEIDSSKLQGSGTLNASVSATNAEIFADKSVTTLNINGDFNSTDDRITFTLDTLTNSTVINVGKNANINNSTLIIRINENLITGGAKNTTVLNSTLLNFSNLSGSGFTNIKFNTYDPSTGQEKEFPDCYSKKTSKSGSNFGLLVSNEACEVTIDESGNVVAVEKNKSSLPVGAIVGIVVGCVVGAALIGVVIFFRNKIPVTKSLKFRLKQVEQQMSTNGAA